uniref:NADH-ubiquinone oxidoreductase chain 2 n=1 Tax=Abacion magnum TaxID=118452 RepID=S4T0Q9_ABAMA|nr:NADH dehydrogenase subunit 2 [Abacion magnum]AFR77010.1 NADH dehydrogenase subunit 2 [Abacion magnum]
MYLPMFILMIMVSSIITLSASSWLTAWMGLEMNLMAFIPLINSNNKLHVEASLKYFFVQATSSIFIFLSAIFQTFMFTTHTVENLPFLLSNLIMSMALLTKLAAAPFHFWFPSMTTMIKWPTLATLLTWQKLAPLFLPSFSSPTMMLLILSSLTSATIGSISGLNQLMIKKILAYSSIAHLAWMLILIPLSESIFTTYFMIYSLITLTIIILMNTTNTIQISQLYTHNVLITLISFSTLLSLGGLPPFTGFIPKLLAIKMMVSTFMLPIVLILVLTSVLTLYYYLRLTYSSFTMNMSSQKHNFLILHFMMSPSMMLILTTSTLPIIMMLTP